MSSACNSLTLRYSLGHRLLAAALLFGFGYVLVPSLFDTSHHDFPTRQLLCAFFLLVFLGMFVEVFVVKISFNGEGIYSQTPWRGIRKMRWNDIASHAYVQIGDWHVLRAKNGDKIRVSRRLFGLKALGEELARRGIIAPEELQQWRTAGSLPNE